MTWCSRRTATSCMRARRGPLDYWPDMPGVAARPRPGGRRHLARGAPRRTLRGGDELSGRPDTPRRAGARAANWSRASSRRATRPAEHMRATRFAAPRITPGSTCCSVTARISGTPRIARPGSPGQLQPGHLRPVEPPARHALAQGARWRRRDARACRRGTHRRRDRCSRHGPPAGRPRRRPALARELRAVHRARAVRHARHDDRLRGNRAPPCTLEERRFGPMGGPARLDASVRAAIRSAGLSRRGGLVLLALLLWQSPALRARSISRSPASRRNCAATCSPSSASSATARAPTSTRTRWCGCSTASTAKCANALRPFGHYEPRCTSEYAAEGNDWRVTIGIEPGPAVLVEAVAIEHRGTRRGRSGLRRAAQPEPPEGRKAVESRRLRAGEGRTDARRRNPTAISTRGCCSTSCWSTRRPAPRGSTCSLDDRRALPLRRGVDKPDGDSPGADAALPALPRRRPVHDATSCCARSSRSTTACISRPSKCRRASATRRRSPCR